MWLLSTLNSTDRCCFFLSDLNNKISFLSQGGMVVVKDSVDASSVLVDE